MGGDGTGRVGGGVATAPCRVLVEYCGLLEICQVASIGCKRALEMMKGHTLSQLRLS